MKKETVIQHDLLTGVRDLGGDGYKANNRFLIGVLDLVIQVPKYPSLFLEVKTCAQPGRPDTPVYVKLEKLQADRIDNIRNAGGYSGWVLVVQEPKAGEHTLVVGWQTAPTGSVLTVSRPYDIPVFRKEWGASWSRPMRWILEMLTTDRPIPKTRGAAPSRRSDTLPPPLY